MFSIADRKLLVVWLALVVITLLSWWVGVNNHEQTFARSQLVTWSVILIAGIKVRMIIRHFMEVSHAGARLRHLADGWLVLALLLLTGFYTFQVGLAL